MREKEEREGVGRGRSPRRHMHGTSSRNAGRYMEKRSGFVHHLDRITTSFYFTNFPETVKVMELWSLFNKYGRVGEVYIPNKLDKKGHRFGFVKFKEVADAKELEGRLGDVWWETYKLRINLSRFNRGVRETNHLKPQRGEEVPPKPQAGSSQRDTASVEQGRSFKNALTMERKKDTRVGLEEPKREATKATEMQPTSIAVKVNEDLWKMFQTSFVGFLKEEKDVIKISEGLVMEGYDWITATFMGENMMLLTSTTSQSLIEAVSLNRKWWEGWFRSILEWSPELHLDRRSVWLRCRGVPLHAWDELTFRQLTDRLGTFIELDMNTANRTKLDVARVKISTSRMTFIDEQILISVLDKKFQISVAEEWGRDELVSLRGGRYVGEWASTASSMASAVAREAAVVGEGMFDGTGSDGDVAVEVGEESEQEEVEGGKGLFVGTRKAMDKVNNESENFMIPLGNSLGVGNQVPAVATVCRDACDGRGLLSQLTQPGLLEHGIDGDKWQQAERAHEDLTIGGGVEKVAVDPREPQSAVKDDKGDGLVVPTEVEEEPFTVGPNSFGPLEDLSPEVEYDLQLRGGVVRGRSPKLGLSAAVQNEGVAGLIVQAQDDGSPLKIVTGVGSDVSYPMESEAGTQKTKKKSKKGQGSKPGMPKCMLFVEAIQGSKVGGRRKKRQKEGCRG
ncbi:zinc finger CCCH domain-containing protein [Trifolium repens]|nr:zinc finger CCCH domain-containing protein [Trifolium repens]